MERPLYFSLIIPGKKYYIINSNKFIGKDKKNDIFKFMTNDPFTRLKYGSKIYPFTNH